MSWIIGLVARIVCVLTAKTSGTHAAADRHKLSKHSSGPASKTTDIASKMRQIEERLKVT